MILYDKSQDEKKQKPGVEAVFYLDSRGRWGGERGRSTQAGRVDAGGSYTEAGRARQAWGRHEVVTLRLELRKQTRVGF